MVVRCIGSDTDFVVDIDMDVYRVADYYTDFDFDLAVWVVVIDAFALTWVGPVLAVSEPNHK
jgi:tagatose-1,6-bisphosphate aldolase non-catalytic subunit AgaZ/GatZ